MKIPPASPSAAAASLPRCLAVTAAIVLAAGLAACSSSHKAASGSPSAAATSGSTTTGAGHKHSRTTSKDSIPGLITFAGTFKLHGASSAKLKFRAFPGVTSPASSCARLAAHGTPAAKGEQPLFRIPAPPAGNHIFYTALVLPYHGPGSYAKDAIDPAGSSITIGGVTYNPRAAQATATVTFSANGSGTFTFANAPASEAGHPSLAGTVHWTCSG
jgi:hypothetical protein